MADPFDDGLLVERVSGRMTPRLEFVCRLHGCYPLDSNFDAWADDDKMGIMDAPGCDADMFSAPGVFERMRVMCLAISNGKGGVSLSSRATPSGVRYLPRTVTSVVTNGVVGSKRKSVFDVVSPPAKGGSKATANATAPGIST